MFGLGEAMLSFLRRQVGLRTDSASSSGSLHARVKEELDLIGTKNPTQQGTDTLFNYFKKLYDTDTKLKLGTPKLDIVSVPSSQQSYIQMFNLMGSGYLIGATLKVSSHGYHSGSAFEVFIDGQKLGAISLNEGARDNDEYSAVTCPVSFMHRFNQSLVFNGRRNQGNGELIISYILD